MLKKISQILSLSIVFAIATVSAQSPTNHSGFAPEAQEVSASDTKAVQAVIDPADDQGRSSDLPVSDVSRNVAFSGKRNALKRRGAGNDIVQINNGLAPTRSRVFDYNGDGRTDFTVVRAAGGAGSQLTWFTSLSGGGATSSRDWGSNGDFILSGDYDADGIDDIAAFRASNGTFYIVESSTFTIRIDQFGQSGDNPRIIGDYDGDGRDDLAVYRPGAQSTWFYKTSPTAVFAAVEWGQTGDFPAPGDYDGDGRSDFVVQRADGANARFFKRLSGGTFTSELFGGANDLVVPGDYDGDNRTDLCVVSNSGGILNWAFEPSGTAGSTVVSSSWGITGDRTVQGDYDGDGKTDFAVWRPGTPATFYVLTVSGNISSQEWGQTGDLPIARINTF